MQRQRVGNQLSGFLKSGSLLSVLLVVNVALWVVSLLFPLVDYLYALPTGSVSAGWHDWLALSSQWTDVLHHPWTLMTYMFLHDGFWQPMDTVREKQLLEQLWVTGSAPWKVWE